MKIRFIVGIFLMAFLASTGYAIDVAIYSQANWWGQDAADREMPALRDAIAASVGSAELFTADDQDALADWVVAHTGSQGNILVLSGQFPNTIYPKGNAEPDGSIAENFLDAGNTILNTGDYAFYVVDSGGDNGQDGFKNMIDVPEAYMWALGAGWTADVLDMTPTADGSSYTPSLVDFQSGRPIQVENYEGTPWELDVALAANDAGDRVEPGVIVNTETGGRVGIFYQNENQDDMPRAAVMSEYILNYYLGNITAVNASDKLTATWGGIKEF